MNTIKFIIKLKKKYRNKEKLILHLSSSLFNFNRGFRKLDDNKFFDCIKNANTKKVIKGRNYNRKYELNSIKEENYSSSVNKNSRNINKTFNDNNIGVSNYNKINSLLLPLSSISLLLQKQCFDKWELNVI
jgi:hypothetical protein